MRIEDIPLEIKPIFERKKMEYEASDIARIRYICKELVEYLIDLQRRKQK